MKGSAEELSDSSYLDSAADHGITALDAIGSPIGGKSWLPPLPSHSLTQFPAPREWTRLADHLIDAGLNSPIGERLRRVRHSERSKRLTYCSERDWG